jgi:uncharacterized caspase-like protein
MRHAAALGLALVVVTSIEASREARAETKLYAIAIGNNTVPANAGVEIAPLHYADDDAAAFFTFARGLGAEARLLTNMDVDSQLRFPELAAKSRAPTLKELRRTVDELRAQMSADVAIKDRPVLLFFYSGHGLGATDDRPAALTLQDEGLTQQRLYEDVLGALPDATIHVLIDACHAEDVVRPRDLNLPVVVASKEEVEQVMTETTLGRFHNVGAIVAAATNGQTHEWDQYHQGVFTHELLSGLRGAADVNEDSAIEYSELGAYLSSANREVPDLRARLKVITSPPVADRRQPIIELKRTRGALRVRFNGGKPGYFYIEDRHGNRLVEMRSEENYRFQLYLPPDEPLYFVSAEKTVEFEGRSGDVLDGNELALRHADLRSRGAMSAALRHGLFAAPFGPNYYRGFVDRSAEMLSVDFRTPELSIPTAPLEPPTQDRFFGGWATTAFSVAAGLGAAAGTFQILAVRDGNAYNNARLERDATSARQHFERDQTIAFVAAAAALGAAGAGGLILWSRYAAHVAPVPIGSPSSLALGAEVQWKW